MLRHALALVVATAVLVAAQQREGGGAGGGGDISGGGAVGGGGGGQASSQRQAGAGGERGGRNFPPLWDLPADQLRFRERPPIRGSIATATNLLLKSGLAHEPMSASVFFTPDTVLTYMNGLPAAGTYKGFMGLFDFANRARLTFHTTSFNYTIPFVDEARGVSIVKLQYGGKFLRSGKTLESTSTVYLKWRLGKIRKVSIVDDEPEAVWKAYATAAELIVGKFYDRLFSCGECAAELLSNDFKVTARIHPKVLGDRLSYSGIEEFKKRVSDENFQLALKQVKDMHFLYGDDNVVVVMYKFGLGSIAQNVALSGIKSIDPTMLPGSHGTSINSLQSLKGVAIIRVRDGKLTSCVGQLSQPLMPWQVAHIEAALPANKGKPFVGGARALSAGEQKPGEQQGKVAPGARPSGEQKPAEQAKAAEQKPVPAPTAEQAKATEQKPVERPIAGGEQRGTAGQQRPAQPLKDDEMFF